MGAAQAHSYGGLVAQHALLVPPQPHATSGAAPVLAAAIMQPDSLRRRARGLALLASLPPSGYGSVAARIAAGGGRRDTAEPRIVVGVPSDPAVCRRKYFATDMPLDKIRGCVCPALDNHIATIPRCWLSCAEPIYLCEVPQSGSC